MLVIKPLIPYSALYRYDVVWMKYPNYILFFFCRGENEHLLYSITWVKRVQEDRGRVYKQWTMNIEKEGKTCIG